MLLVQIQLLALSANLQKLRTLQTRTETELAQYMARCTNAMSFSCGSERDEVMNNLKSMLEMMRLLQELIGLTVTSLENTKNTFEQTDLSLAGILGLES